MHDTAELSIGALSALHGLCTIWGFFLFRVLAALLVALIKIPMHFYRKSTSSDVLPRTPDLAHTHGLVPKSGTFTGCVLGGARFHRLPEGVNDFTGNNQLGIVEGWI